MARLNNERMVDGVGFPDGVRRAMALQQGDRWLVITLFATRDALDAAEERFEAMGEEIPESVRGRRVALDSYEVIFDVEMVR